MNENTRRLAGNAILGLGLLLFLVGGATVALGTPVDAPLAALGALALIFVGVGASTKNRTRPRAT